MDLEKEALKNSSTGLTGTRRILPKEVYELEGYETEDKPKGWLSWFRGIYGREVQEDKQKSEPSVKRTELTPQKVSSEPNATTENDSKPTSILSKILPTAQKNDSAIKFEQVGVRPTNTTTESHYPPKECGSKP